MGGEGSGRKVDPVKALMKANNATVNPSISSNMFLPNYSGVKESTKKTNSDILITNNNISSYVTAETDPLSLHLDQTTPQTIYHGRASLSEAGININNSIAAPTAPTAALAGVGAGNVNAGWHYYRVAYITAYGTTAFSVNSNTITTTAGDGKVNLTNIPVSADPQVTGRRLWRTKKDTNGGNFLADINDNTTTTYLDNLADLTTTNTDRGTGGQISENRSGGALGGNGYNSLAFDASGNTYLSPFNKVEQATGIIRLGNQISKGDFFYGQLYGCPDPLNPVGSDGVVLRTRNGGGRVYIGSGEYSIVFGGTIWEGVASLITMTAANLFGINPCSAIQSASGRNLVLYSQGWGNLAWSGPYISGTAGTGTSDGNQHRDLAFNSYYINTDDRAVYTAAYSFKTNQNAAGLAPYYHTIWGIPTIVAGDGLGVACLTNRAAFGIGTVAKLSALQVRPTADFVAVGTTTTNASTTIAGTLTKFTFEIALGDRISLSSAATTWGIVTAIASDTSLTVSTALGNGTSQTINVKKSIANLTDSSGATALFINDLKSVGIGTIQPTQILDVNGNINATGYYVGTTAGISATIVTAQLTALGAQGSMTFVNGILTAQTPAT